MYMSIWLGLAIITIAEATIGIFVQLIGDDVSILTLSFYRMLFATVFLAAVMPFFFKKFWRFPKRNFKDTFIIGALIMGEVTVFNIALTLVPIANAVIFWSVSPFFAFIFSWLFIKEKVTREHVYIFIVAFIGILIAEPLGGGNMIGNLVALGSGAIYAALVTYMRHEGITEEQTDIFWSFVFGTLLLVPVIFIFGPGNIFALSTNDLFGLHAPVIVWVAALGVFSTGLAFLMVALVLRKIKAGTYSLIDTIVSPIVAALLAFVIFTQIPSLNMIYGGALLLISGYWITRRMMHAQPVPVTRQ